MMATNSMLLKLNPARTEQNRFTSKSDKDALNVISVMTKHVQNFPRHMEH